MTPLQEFIELGGKPALFLKAPTGTELLGLITGMRWLKDKYPQYWRAEQ